MKKTNKQKFMEALERLEDIRRHSPDGFLEESEHQDDVKIITRFLMSGETEEKLKERIRYVLERVKKDDKNTA